MFLFHGTTATNAHKALREGLKPRGLTGISNYKAQSHAKAVYLTDAYAPYFSMNTKDKDFKDGGAVLVIDTSKLSIAHLAADEDALEQASRHWPVEEYERTRVPLRLMSTNMQQRTLWFRQNQFNLAAFGYDWRWSLKVLGTCCYHGIITPSAMVKVVEWHDMDLAANIMMVFDPFITLANYRFVGAKYRYLLQEFCRMNTGHTMTEFDAFGLNMEIIRRNIFDKVTISST